MEKNEKALLIGVVAGAAIATAVITGFVHKTLKAAEVHLFNMDNQEDKEELIDSLIPKTEDDGDDSDESCANPYAIPRTPSHHGKDCLTNGEHEGIECECDECLDYLTCFPEWETGDEPTKK